MFAELKKKIDNKIIYIGIMLVNYVISWSYMAFNRGNGLQNYFVSGANFSDFFSPILKDRLTTYGEPYFSNYPPLANLISIFFKRFTDKTVYSEFQGDLGLSMMFIMFMMVCFLLLYKISRLYLNQGENMVNIAVIMVTLFSGPFLFLYNRANNILLVLVLVMYFIKYYESENKVLKELALIALAVAAAIKVYPVVFGILLLKKDNIKVCVRAVLYGLAFFFVPFLFYNGIGTVGEFFSNLFGGYGAYFVNHVIGIQGSIQIFSGLLSGQILIEVSGAVTLAALIICLAIYVGSKEKWKKIFALSMLFIWGVKGSYLYNICFLAASLFLFLEKKEKKKIDKWYLIQFCVLFMIYFLPPATELNVLLAQAGLGAISWSMVVTDLGLLIMMATLLIETIYVSIRECRQKRIGKIEKQNIEKK